MLIGKLWRWQGYQAVGEPAEEGGGSWRRGKSFPETAATEMEEGGAMARSDLEPEDLAAVISVLEYAITNFRCASLALCHVFCCFGTLRGFYSQSTTRPK